jgi:hypothetical protein
MPLKFAGHALAARVRWLAEPPAIGPDSGYVDVQSAIGHQNRYGRQAFGESGRLRE